MSFPLSMTMVAMGASCWYIIGYILSLNILNSVSQKTPWFPHRSILKFLSVAIFWWLWVISHPPFSPAMASIGASYRHTIEYIVSLGFLNSVCQKYSWFPNHSVPKFPPSLTMGIHTLPSLTILILNWNTLQNCNWCSLVSWTSSYHPDVHNMPVANSMAIQSPFPRLILGLRNSVLACRSPADPFLTMGEPTYPRANYPNSSWKGSRKL